jgi:hypothetical protein
MRAASRTVLRDTPKSSAMLLSRSFDPGSNWAREHQILRPSAISWAVLVLCT